MQNKSKKIFLTGFIFILLVSMLTLQSCGKKDQDDIVIGGDGTITVRPGSKAPTITFWGYGDDVELQVFKTLTDEFNKEYENIVQVEYVQKSSEGYEDALKLTLNGSNAPDVFYCGDSGYKSFAENGYVLDITDYIENSNDYVISEMWETVVSRFLYDTTTGTTTGPNAKYYGVPKDIGPTVIFYNETMFTTAGIKVISVAAEDLEAFNNGAADDRNNTKAALGFPGDYVVKEKGYFVDSNNQKWFNNQVPMSWEETVAISNVIQEKFDPDGTRNIYGYFTEWWFNYGWSVGGDCIQYVESDDPAYEGGYYDFTLMDDTPNYIVADDAGSFTANGNTYQAGEIISYTDKLVSTAAATKTIRPEILTATQSGTLNELPSQREAFTEFVRLGSKKTSLVDIVDGDNLYGYGITPYPSSIGGDAGKTNAFATGQIAMLVDGRWNVTNFRRQMSDNWDVAPLPMYKEYDENGDITVHGIEAGHSGSVGLCIWSKTQVPNAAWAFIEFLGGERGQTLQAEQGFAIPLQKDIANSEVFLQSNQKPQNAKVFIKAAEYQRAGDWWYLTDKEWIDDWANILNGSVRNGKVTLSGFFASREYNSTYDKLKKYTEAGR